MRRFLLHITALLLFVGLIAPPALCRAADNKPAKAAFRFTSILAKHVEGEEVKYVGINDDKLKGKLKSLDYNYYEAVNNGSKKIAEGDTDQYDMVDGMNCVCKVTVIKIEKWTDTDGNTHTYITFKAVAIKHGPDGDENMVTVERKREAGEYLILVFQDFFPAKDGEEAQDMVLAIQPGA